MKMQLRHNYEDIISMENLLESWKEFLKGKRNKLDVQEFYMHMMDNVIDLHDDLSNHTYKHGSYQTFKINDPKPRIIHKANVRDRLLYHAVYRILYPFFDKTFIYDSYSCRLGKGTHKALNRFRVFSNKASKNNTRTCWVLKCDIKKFFASVNQSILIDMLKEYISDNNTLKLLKSIIFSFNSGIKNTGLPLGNLTSQLFANIYLNKLDRFVKHDLKEKFYIRYSDDFVILSDKKENLIKVALIIDNFLNNELKLSLHKDKILIKTLNSGVDFLGWINFPRHRILRNKTKNRIINSYSDKSLSLYSGILKHGNCYKIKKIIDRIAISC